MRLLLLCIIVLSCVQCASVTAQNKVENCRINYNSPPRAVSHWPQDARVKVYLTRSSFSREQQAALLAAMKKWNDGVSHSSAAVRFEYAGEIDSILSCANCLTVTRREVHKNDPKHYAFFRPLKLDNDGLLAAAWIELDMKTKSPKAVQGYMVHELGHSLGLWDCTSCKRGTTIMNSFPGVDENNGLIEPAKCDLEIVRLNYWLRHQNWDHWR